MMGEIKDIPKGWKIVELKSITDSIQYGYTESSTKEAVGPKFLRITDIQENKVEWNEVPYCKIDSEIKKKYLLKDGDLVFARTGATVGKSFLIKGEIPEAVFASYLIRVRVNLEMNEKYLSYFFHSPNYWSQITEGQVGIGQPNVNGTKLGQLKISIAPLPEQQAIVSKIEELLSDLENGKQQLQTAQQQLKVYRQSLLKWTFEGKLTEDWRKKQKKLITSKVFITEISEKREVEYSIKLDEWKKLKVNSINEKTTKPRKPSNLDPKNILYEGLVEKGSIPFEWEIVPLVFVSGNQPNSIVDGPFGSSINVNEDYIQQGVPVIRMVNIRPFKFVQDQMKFIKDYKFQSLRRHNILPEDILIAKVGATIGDCCIYPINQPEAMLSTTGSCRIRVDKNVINIKYLECYISFHRNSLKNIASQTAQPFLNMKVIKSFPIVLPTIKEQLFIVDELESKLTVCDKIEETISQSLQQAETLRQSILKKAFEGKLINCELKITN